ncbi:MULTISPECIES: capsule biosynthesis GfcC family protein [Luteibacter]|uniref:capsule biosynthesis GfcC family protein n=1 Tax=Luteibacter TaxID=242605 RepID=UPI00056BEF68|nr:MULTISPECIES: capsule biosynthesis GfcC family protein [unclassified Luteibacter]
MRGIALFSLLVAMAGPSFAQTGVTVTVDGAVARPGSDVYPAGARLSAPALAAGVSPDAYLLGAAWLQPALQRDQLRLRAGLEYELGAIRRQAMAKGQEDLSIGAAAFQRWFARLPVTGRRTLSALDPFRLEVTPADNWPVHDGDRLFYPTRPRDIRVVGAVNETCRLPQVGFRDARDYLKDCPVSKAADPNMIFVVQPDGAVFQQNIALWNRDAPRVLAPGAWIYVPFDNKAIAGAADDDFNHDIAAFLATQLLNDEGAR